MSSSKTNLLPRRDPKFARQLLNQALMGIGMSPLNTADQLGEIVVRESSQKRATALTQIHGKFVLVTIEICDPQN